jgi:hypothetical protein
MKVLANELRITDTTKLIKQYRPTNRWLEDLEIIPENRIQNLLYPG